MQVFAAWGHGDNAGLAEPIVHNDVTPYSTLLAVQRSVVALVGPVHRAV